MRRLFILVIAILIAIPSMAQKPKFGGNYYDCRLAAHLREGMPQNAVIWFGDSITEQGWWNMLSKEKNMVNRAIGGDNTYGMLHRLPLYLDASPRKIFIMAGINDISANYPVADVIENISKMIDLIHEKAPACEIYIQSAVTPNNEVLAYDYIKNKQAQVKELNTRLEQLCKYKSAVWVDIAPLLHNEQGELRVDLTKDGIHIHPEAYVIWVDYLKKMKYLRK